MSVAVTMIDSRPGPTAPTNPPGRLSYSSTSSADAHAAHVQRIKELHADAQQEFRLVCQTRWRLPLRWYVPACLHFADAGIEAEYDCWHEDVRRPVARGATLAFFAMMVLFIVNNFWSPDCLNVLYLVQILVILCLCACSAVFVWLPSLCFWKYWAAAVLTAAASVCTGILVSQPGVCVHLSERGAEAMGIGINMSVLLLFGAGLVLQPMVLTILSTLVIASWGLLLAVLDHKITGTAVCVPLFAIIMALYTRYVQESRRFYFFTWNMLSNQLYAVDQSKAALVQSQDEAMRQKAAAAKAAAAKEMHQAILGYTCHELRNPLHGLRGCLEELTTTCVPGHYVNREDALNFESIEAAVEQMTRVTDDVLDFNKLESGKLQIIPRAVKIRDTVARVVMQFQNRHDGIILCDIAEDVPDTVQSDELRVTQILLNGVTNALKHCTAGTPVRVLCFVDQRTSMVQLEVLNTGTGLKIPASRLFGAYERGADESNQSIKGTGLGLPIAKMLVDLLQGKIGLEDRGAITAFWFQIPLKAVQTESGADVTALVPGHIELPMNAVVSAEVDAFGGSASFALSPSRAWKWWSNTKLRRHSNGVPLTIAVIDDEKINRRLISSMVRRLGHSVVEYADGDEILPAITSGQHLDYCIMDIHMLRTDGRDVSKQLRAAGCTFPIIAATANAAASDLQTYRESGFDGVLSKPFVFADVQSVLNVSVQ